MVSFAIFTLSGTALIVLTLAKRVEEKRGKTFFILKVISKGDEQLKVWNHETLHFYSHGKDKAAFLIKKQLPMRAKNIWNKFVAYIKETSERYMGDMRDSRLLKKPDGISEFFKNMNEVEKGNGEINEGYDDREIEAVPSEVIEEVPVKIAKKRAARRKKVKVLEIK